MTNHPNRNWRAAMQRRCAEFLARLDWPANGIGMLTADQLRDLMAQAYRAGYTERHQRDQTRNKA